MKRPVRKLISILRHPRWWAGSWLLRLKQQQLVLAGRVVWRGPLWIPPCPPCPDCGHEHRLSLCALCTCSNTGWR